MYGNTLAGGDFNAGEEGGVPFYDADCFVCSGGDTSGAGAGGEAPAGKRKRGLRRGVN